MKNISLIDDWRSCLRLYSVHALLVSVVLGLVEALLYACHLTMPVPLVAILNGLIGISGIVGRVVKQDPRDTQRIADLRQGVTHEQ